MIGGRRAAASLLGSALALLVGCATQPVARDAPAPIFVPAPEPAAPVAPDTPAGAAEAAPGMPLDGDVFSPLPGVLCDRAARHPACFDRYGVSLALTGNHLGLPAANHLEGVARRVTFDRAALRMSDGVTCFPDAGVCTMPDLHRAGRQAASPDDPVAPAHTRALFGR